MSFRLVPSAAACLQFCFLRTLAFAIPVEISTAEIRNPQQPQVTANARGTIFIAFGSGNEIYLVSSHDAGKTFDAPAKVGGFEKLALGCGAGHA